MSLNIENEISHRLARKPDAFREASLDVADTQAIPEKQDKEKVSTGETRLEWLLKLSERTAPLMNDGRSTKELFDELYDEETGLPK